MEESDILYNTFKEMIKSIEDTIYSGYRSESHFSGFEGKRLYLIRDELRLLLKKIDDIDDTKKRVLLDVKKNTEFWRQEY